MNFKEYLQELANIDVAQAATAHETTSMASVDVENPIAMARINAMLNSELSVEPILTPHAGIQRIRKILHRYGFDLPALYQIDPDGDELHFELFQFGRVNLENTPDAYLYMIYAPTDNGYYDFYSEVVNESGLDEIYDAGDDGEEELEREMNDN
jgi:hypothetical protein